MQIKYLQHKEIDKLKWDACLSMAKNELVYGYSWYLDIVCHQWDALVLGDYKAVMPLPWKQKLGLKYIYHPFFSQQLGVFYPNGMIVNVSEFINAIPSKFVKYAFSLNHFNADEELNLSIGINYILNLNKPYEEIFSAYDSKCRRNVKLSKKENVTMQHNLSIESLLEFKKQNLSNKLLHTHFTIIESLLKQLLHKKQVQIHGAFTENNDLVAAVAFIYHKNRIIYLFSASSSLGKKLRAMYRIIDEEIHRHSGKEVYFDFEGSMIENIARFFKGFGGITETYYRLRKSKIPFIK